MLVTLGLLLLLFVVYQLWGTGLYTARAQNRLRDEFNQALHSHQRDTTTTTPTASEPTTTTTLAPVEVPANGHPVATMVIPKIGIDFVAVEGVDVDDLRDGLGHYPGTQLPGHEGNTAFAGHRTTYKHPFGDLDQLSSGDEIDLALTNGAKYVYRVTEQRVVDPSEVSVLDPTPDPARPGHDLATITLTTCNPKLSAQQRLIIKGTLEMPAASEPLPPAPTPAGKHHYSIAGLSGDRSSSTPTILWAAITLAIGLLWWLAFHRHPWWLTWLAGAVPFLAALFICYTYLERLLPSNY